MKLQTKKVLTEIHNAQRKKSLLRENIDGNQTLINVDIQPEYQDHIHFNLHQWAETVNNHQGTVVLLYNGHDTLGMITREEYISWRYDLGVSENRLDDIVMYDKGYAFFRYCMDNAIDHEAIVDLIRFMMTHHIADSRDIDQKMWEQYMEETHHDQQDVRDLMENADDMIYIPELMDFLNGYNNIILTGGGIDECLKEVEIALMALSKPYTIYRPYTF